MVNTFYSDWLNQSPTVQYKEIDLFRLLAKLLSKHIPVVFSEQTHGRVAQVEFSSSFFPGKKFSCEISDLLVLVFSKKQKFLRATFLQAKRRKHYCNNIHPRFSFTGNLNQYDLLSNRPIIKGKGKFKPDPNILNKAILNSIGSYGIFYRSHLYQQIEFYYSIASNIIPRSYSKDPIMFLPSVNNNYFYSIGGHDDLISCPSIKQFISYLIAMKIGSPINIYNKENSIIREIVSSHSLINNEVRNMIRNTFNISDNISNEQSQFCSLLLIEAPEEY